MDVEFFFHFFFFFTLNIFIWNGWKLNFIKHFRGVYWDVCVTLFLWATDVMNYSNMGPPLSKSYWIVFFWLYNSFVRPHFHVCYSTCNFSGTPFQNPHMKTWTVPGPCPHLSWCPSTCSFLVPATFPGQNWVHSHMHSPTCSGVKRTNTGLLSTLCGLLCLTWAASETPWLTRAEAQARRWGLLALNPCSATPKSSSLSYCRCLLPSAIWCWCRHGVLEPWQGTPGLWSRPRAETSWTIWSEGGS